MRNAIRTTLFLLGATAIVVSGAFTLRYMADQVVFRILVPGFVIGLILIVIAVRIGANNQS